MIIQIWNKCNVVFITILLHKNCFIGILKTTRYFNKLLIQVISPLHSDWLTLLLPELFTLIFARPIVRLILKMISRRNIRVKVMQVLYMLGSQEDLINKEKSLRILKVRVDESSKLFIYLLSFIVKVAKYADTDAKHRASKHIVTAEDLNVNVKLTENLLVDKILSNLSFIEWLKEKPVEFEDTGDQVKKVYQSLVSSDLYKQYISTDERQKATEHSILKHIFKDQMLPSESFISHIEEHFTNWDDDADIMLQLMINFLQKPDGYDLKEIVGNEKWEFAKLLLETVIDKREYVISIIKPKLKNWDSERIALLDMILIQMGICEFLYFETIPPKVTINEYIDLAKEYSTQQSGQFINGILDGIHKDLLAENKIHKINFR